MGFASGKQRVAAYLAEKAKEQGLPVLKRSHHKKSETEPAVEMAKPAYPKLQTPLKGGLLQGSSSSHFDALPKFKLLKSKLKI